MSSLSLEEIKSMSPREAIQCLDIYIEAHPEDDEAYTLRGQRKWALNKRGEAISDYLAALKINPASHAKVLLDYANSILEFYNKDLLNP